MSNQKPFLGELEKEIMDRIWKQTEPVSVRFIFEDISESRKIAYTTVMTIIGRLQEKGLLKRKTEGKAYLYEAAYSKDKFLAKASQQIIKSFVASFGDAAVAHFAQEIEKIPADKRRKLLKMLQNAK